MTARPLPIAAPLASLATLASLASLATLAALALALGACREKAPPDVVVAAGWLEAREAAVIAPAAGRVTRVTAELGAEVGAGDVLVQLETSVVEAQLTEAEAALDAASAELERVRSGPSAHELAVAEAALAAAAARWDGARSAWAAAAAGARAAGPAGGVAATAGATVAAAERAYLQAEAELEAARAALGALQDLPHPAQVTAAAAAVDQSRAALDAVLARRSALALRSPISGRVALRAVEPGELARPGATLLRVADPARLTLTVYLPAEDVARIRPGQAVTVTATENERTARGRVEHVAAAAEFAPRGAQTKEQRAGLVFAVRIAVDNAGLDLRAGMHAEATVATD